AQAAGGEAVAVAPLADLVDQGRQYRKAAHEAVRLAALEGQLRGGLVPAVPLDPHQHVGGNENIVKEDFVEVGLAGEIPDGAHIDAGGPHVDQELGQPLVLDLAVAAGAEQADQDRKSTRLNSSHVKIS